MITNTKPLVAERECLTIDNLTEDALRKLINNQVCAIRVPGYTETSLCDNLSDWFLSHDQIKPYYHEIRDNKGVQYLEYGVERVGIPYNTTYDKQGSQKWEEYYAEALPNMIRLRRACYPYLSPIDRFRVELDELWPHGANVACFENRKMFVGIGRIMYPQTSHLAESQPHFDSVPEKLKHLEGQFSANIYLQLPEAGGELEIWNVPPLPINVIDNADINTDWRNQLPSSFLIKPNKGDLVLINTRRAHAVRSFCEGQRVTVQCFIGLNSEKTLCLWN